MPRAALLAALILAPLCGPIPSARAEDGRTFRTRYKLCPPGSPTILCAYREPYTPMPLPGVTLRGGGEQEVLCSLEDITADERYDLRKRQLEFGTTRFTLIQGNLKKIADASEALGAKYKAHGKNEILDAVAEHIRKRLLPAQVDAILTAVKGHGACVDRAVKVRGCWRYTCRDALTTVNYYEAVERFGIRDLEPMFEAARPALTAGLPEAPNPPSRGHMSSAIDLLARASRQTQVLLEEAPDEVPD